MLINFAFPPENVEPQGGQGGSGEAEIPLEAGSQPDKGGSQPDATAADGMTTSGFVAHAAAQAVARANGGKGAFEAEGVWFR